MKINCSKCKKELHVGTLVLSVGGEDFCTNCARLNDPAYQSDFDKFIADSKNENESW